MSPPSTPAQRIKNPYGVFKSLRWTAQVMSTVDTKWTQWTLDSDLPAVNF